MCKLCFSFQIVLGFFFFVLSIVSTFVFIHFHNFVAFFFAFDLFWKRLEFGSLSSHPNLVNNWMTQVSSTCRPFCLQKQKKKKREKRNDFHYFVLYSKRTVQDNYILVCMRKRTKGRVAEMEIVSRRVDDDHWSKGLRFIQEGVRDWKVRNIQQGRESRLTNQRRIYSRNLPVPIIISNWYGSFVGDSRPLQKRVHLSTCRAVDNTKGHVTDLTALWAAILQIGILSLFSNALFLILFFFRKSHTHT